MVSFSFVAYYFAVDKYAIEIVDIRRLVVEVRTQKAACFHTFWKVLL